MQELAALVEGAIPRTANQCDTDTLVTIRRGDHHVLEPRMHEAVPQHVDEADERTVAPSAHPAEAVLLDLLHPVPFLVAEYASVEGFGMQCVHLAVLEVAAPFVADRHAVILRAGAAARRYRFSAWRPTTSHFRPATPTKASSCSSGSATCGARYCATSKGSTTPKRAGGRTAS